MKKNEYHGLSRTTNRERVEISLLLFLGLSIAVLLHDYDYGLSLLAPIIAGTALGNLLDIGAGLCVDIKRLERENER